MNLQFTRVGSPRLFEQRYQSAQPELWQEGSVRYRLSAVEIWQGFLPRTAILSC